MLMVILPLGLSLLMMLLGNDEEELVRIDGECVSLLMKALFVTPLIVGDGC
jgi:hypothetical protein